MAVSADAVDLMEYLEALGVAVLPVAEDDRLPKPVGSHPDLRLHHLGGGEVVLHPGSEALFKALAGYGFGVSYLTQGLGDVYPGEKYPSDCVLDACVVGERVFSLEHEGTRPLLERHRALGRRHIPVAQGYAKCATVVVSEGAILTADPSIGKAALAAGLRVLTIRPGGILLPGYDTGLIGGCCGLMAPGRLLFYGEGERHPDWERMVAFCREEGVTVSTFGKGPLRDIGSILPLMEL